MSTPAAGQAFGWRSPAAMLMLMAVANQLAFATWWTLSTNFAVQVIGMNGAEFGVQQSLREVPGFLAFTVVFVLLLMREQTLAVVSLFVLGAGVAATGFFPSVWGFLITTMIMSVGFHYYETMNQSLSLQWLDKRTAPLWIGRIISAGAIAQLFAYGAIAVLWEPLGLTFVTTFAIAGGATILVTIVVALVYPRFPQGVVQNKGIVLRRRYWLYYALTFFDGARRQIFIVFAALLMVQKFGYGVTEMGLLFLVNGLVNVFVAPRCGAAIVRFGERNTMTVEQIGLVIVFVAYAVVGDPIVAGFLFCLDNAIWQMHIAHRTYFQKIADPADIAPTAGVAFSINHIAAIVLPALLGLVWLWEPAAVFLIGAGIAACGFVLTRFVPHDPRPGRETLLSRAPAAAPAE
jgi:predicted MFS family arabinose efflux permease